MEDDSGAILCQISSYKAMLDQVNEEIEANIQRTRCIESKFVRCSEIEKNYLMRESELMKMVSAGEFELNGLTEVAVMTAHLLELVEKDSNLEKLNLENMLKRMSQKRETFIKECNQFQEEIVTGESKEFHKLLCEKEALEKEKQSLISKINVLNNSTAEFIEEVLGELHSSTSALQVQIQHASLENMKVLKDIDEMRILLLKLV